jgi:hypothetical protein
VTRLAISGVMAFVMPLVATLVSVVTAFVMALPVLSVTLAVTALVLVISPELVEVIQIPDWTCPPKRTVRVAD